MAAALTSLVVIIALVVLLSIITESLFTEALEEIAERLKMPSSVAGATLMAMGSSAPELFIALLSLFQGGGEHADLGIGTIVGSAVFNILVITGAAGLVRPAAARMSVVLRDSTIYVLAIGALLYAVRDGEITLLEPVIFLALYALYLGILFYWKQDELHIEEPAAAPNDTAEKKSKKSREILHRIITLPTGDPRKNAWWTFFFSVFTIGGLCWFLVEHAVIFSEALGIPPVVVGLTILAGGTSVPDMLSSMIAARKGKGEMAIANAVGSNIFDILIGLGLPWIIALVALGRDVHVGVDGLWTSTLILLGTVFMFVFFMWTGRRLSRLEAGTLLATYVAYVVYVYMSAAPAT